MSVRLSSTAVSVIDFFSPGGSGSLVCPNVKGRVVGPNVTPPPSPDPDPDVITHRPMDSKVLGGVVPISWTPDGGTVLVDGVSYSAKEIGELMARHPDAETMRAVHETKRTFEGVIQ